jgi:predicted TIM-barrel fold metal-dependent hydrolase
MNKVDTHFHIWNLLENYYPWLTDKVQPRVIGEYADIRKNYLIEDFFQDVGQTGVYKAVHVQAEHDPSDPVRETRWLQQVADQPASRGFPQAIVAYADLGAENAQQMLEAHCQYANMRGIRQSLIQHKVDPTVKDPRESALFTRNFKLLERLNLSFDIQLFHPDMEFGADRCMFASNFPVDKMSRGYSAYWSAFETITASFSDEERAQLFHRNAEKSYRI